MGDSNPRTEPGTELVEDATHAETPASRTHTLPEEVVAFDDDLFKRICNHLGEVGILDRPNRTTALTLDIEAGTHVRVTHVEEETEEGWTRRPLEYDDGGIPYAHAVELSEEEVARCEDCGAVHGVGPDLDPVERGCMCGGDLILVERIPVDDLRPGLPYDDAPEWVASTEHGTVSEEWFLTVYGEEAARELTQADRLQYSPTEALFYVEEDHGGDE